jgi:hypothetical protein
MESQGRSGAVESGIMTLLSKPLSRSALIHLPLALTALAPAYFLFVAERISRTADWLVVGVATIAVLWGLFLVFFAPSAWPVGGHTVFALYVAILVGFASAYHLFLTKRVSYFRIDQELDLDEVRVARNVQDLTTRLRYLAAIYAANEEVARLVGGIAGTTRQLVDEFESTYMTGDQRVFCALFGSSDTSVKDISLVVLEQEYSRLPAALQTIRADEQYLDQFRDKITRIREHKDSSEMAYVVERYWEAKTKGKTIVYWDRIPFPTVLDHVNELFHSLDSGRQAVVDNARTRESYLNMLYFSFVVGSTLGFGDIVPNGPVVRLAVVVQLLLVMFVIVIAVNKWTRRLAADRGDGKPARVLGNDATPSGHGASAERSTASADVLPD